MIPFETANSPSIITELLYRLKIKDIMTHPVRSADTTTRLREIQTTMRENKVSGVPIVEDDRLVGMISVDDIIRALDQGYIDSPCGTHMSRKLVVLEDDMPVSMGLSHFEKYRFGRFPVINRDKELVGIVTSRDITSALLMEMNRALETLEAEINSQAAPVPAGEVKRVFVVRQFDYENAGRASTELKRLLQERGVSRKTQRNAAVASYELEMNIVNHSLGGRMIYQFSADQVQIEATDRGPGIPDLGKAMTEGFSTANDWIRSLGFGAGMGLPNTKRVSDEFAIESTVGKGTTVKVLIRFDTPTPQEPPA
jgi:CBS domain-containing protein/anti-sigma regulatory factor (Ser/Thr protein kinase)